jgi:hypothetical protein
MTEVCCNLRRNLQLSWHLHPCLCFLLQNPAYKGKWSAPIVDNPAYKGVWKPADIPNPDYEEDSDPLTNIGKVCGGRIGQLCWLAGRPSWLAIGLRLPGWLASEFGWASCRLVWHCSGREAVIAMCSPLAGLSYQQQCHGSPCFVIV